MENHPIPQDVTGFQFRLIGAMTVKQFAFVAIGSVSAVIMFYAPLFFLIKVILIPLFVLGGLAFAFLPLEGRPLDEMLSHFIKALFNPNQYLYHKAGGKLALSTVNIQKFQTEAQTVEHRTANVKAQQARAAKLNMLLTSLSATPHSELDQKEAQRMQALFATPMAAIPAPTPPTPIPTPVTTPTAPAPTFTPVKQAPVAPPPVEAKPAPKMASALPPASQPPPAHSGLSSHSSLSGEAGRLQSRMAGSKTGEADAPEKQEEKLTDEAEKLQEEIGVAKTREAQYPAGEAAEQAHTRTTELEKHLQDVLSQKQQLEKELSALRQQLGASPAQKLPPASRKTYPAAKKEEPTLIRKVSRSIASKVGLPVAPDTPNLLTGIVKDARDNILSGILIEVKDKNGLPVRAFKTNTLGQFASATPLADGTYTIEFEDPKGLHSFENVSLTASGLTILPIEVTSQDAREQLRKELFT